MNASIAHSVLARGLALALAFAASTALSSCASAPAPRRHPTSEPIRLPTESSAAWEVLPAEELERLGPLYVISDVHGAFARLMPLLEKNEIIDASGKWKAKNALLIVVGDLINKGEDSVKIVWFLQNLAKQAHARGGRVVITLGNHEANLLKAHYAGKTDFLTPELKANLEKDGAELHELVSWFDILPIGAILRGGDRSAMFFHSGYLKDPAWVAEADAIKSKSGPEGAYDSPILLGPESLLEGREFELRVAPPVAAPATSPATTTAGAHSAATSPAPAKAPDFTKVPKPDWSRDKMPAPEDVSQLPPNERGKLVRESMDELGIHTIVFGHQPLGFKMPGWIAMSADRRLVKVDVGMTPEPGKGNHSLGLILHCPSALGFAREGITDDCRQLTPDRRKGEPRNALPIIRTGH